MGTAETPALRTVFVATDFSDAADEALRQAHDRASAAEAKLVVCHVVPNLVGVNFLFPSRFVSEVDAQVELQRHAAQLLNERARQVTGRSEGQLETVIGEGTAYPQIIELAERARADLLVVGGHGTTGFPRIGLGSISQQVVRYAHASVLVARAGNAAGPIMVATDLSELSLPALVVGAREAARRGVPLTVLHCLEPMPFTPAAPYGAAFPSLSVMLREARERAATELAETIARAGVQGKARLLEGAPAAAIVTAAHELGAQLLVVGTRGKTGVARVALGSVAEAVVRHASCSVEVVRQGGAG